MRTATRGVPIFVVAAAAAAVAFGGDDSNTLPATPAEALSRATPAIEAARKAKSAETADIAKSIRRAVDVMAPFAKKAASDETWSASWNEALTLTRFHGNKPTAEYTLQTKTVAGGIVAGLPVGRRWSAQAGEPRPGHLQQYGGIERLRADRTPAVSISICVYSFNTIYTGSGRQGGVGGENATGLAKEFLDYDKFRLVKVESASTSISARPLSKAFPRAQYYEIVGKSKDSGRVRLRSYFAKTSTQTWAFDVTQFLDAVADDTPAEAWQNAGEDPELEAVLQSFDESKDKK
jgi:hypothetical protein